MAGIFASEPQSIGGVLDQVFRLAKAALRPVLPFALAQAVVTLLLQVIRLWPVLTSGDTRALSQGELPGPIALLALPLYALVLVISMAAIYRVYEIGAAVEPPSTAWERGRRRAWPGFLASLLLMLPIVLLGVIAAIAVPALHLEKVGPGPLIVVGVIALAGTLQWLSRAFLCVPGVVVDSLGPVSAITASLRLTRGRVLRLSGVLLVGLVVIVGIYFLVGLLAGVVGALLARGLALPPVMFGALIAMVVTFLVAVPIAAFSTSLTLSLWHDLKLRAEGSDLGAQIDALRRDA